MPEYNIHIKKGLALRPDLKTLDDFVLYIEQGNHKAVLERYCGKRSKNDNLRFRDRESNSRQK